MKVVFKLQLLIAVLEFHYYKTYHSMLWSWTPATSLHVAPFQGLLWRIWPMQSRLLCK